MFRGICVAFAMCGLAIQLALPAGLAFAADVRSPTAATPKASARFEAVMRAEPGYELVPSGKNAVAARPAGGAGGQSTTANCACSNKTGPCKLTIDPDKTTATCSKPDVGGACSGTCEFERVKPQPSSGTAARKQK